MHTHTQACLHRAGKHAEGEECFQARAEEWYQHEYRLRRQVRKDVMIFTSYVCMYVCMYVCVRNVHIYIYTYRCMCVRVYI